MKNCWRDVKATIWLKEHPSTSPAYSVTIQINFKQIQRIYKLSRSTVRRLQCFQQGRKVTNQEELKEVYISNNMNEDAKNLIIEYLCPPQNPRTTKMIQKHIEMKLRESYKSHKISKFVCEEMRYSYKKGSSRPAKYGTKRVQLVKVLHWAELLKLFLDGKVVINVDESSFDRSVKNQYSWLPRGKNAPIINDTIQGKATLIVGTWSTGEWFSVAIVGTVNSVKFCVFLKLLEIMLQEIYSDEEDFPIVVLDNAKTHTSKLSKKLIGHLAYGVKFSAPDWPEVAPVEQVFKKIKSKLRSSEGISIINFEKEKGLATIFRLLHSIEPNSSVNDWIQIIREARRTIISFNDIAIRFADDEKQFTGIRTSY